MNEASIIIMMGIAGFLWAVAAYSVGVKEGERKGYARGRAVGRESPIGFLKSYKVGTEGIDAVFAIGNTTAGSDASSREVTQ